MLQACLGLGFDAEQMRIILNEPMMPAFLDQIVLRNLTIGEGRADVAVRRSGQNVVVDVLERRGPVRVLTAS
jgi:hypothetical protein